MASRPSSIDPLHTEETAKSTLHIYELPVHGQMCATSAPSTAGEYRLSVHLTEDRRRHRARNWRNSPVVSRSQTVYLFCASTSASCVLVHDGRTGECAQRLPHLDPLAEFHILANLQSSPRAHCIGHTVSEMTPCTAPVAYHSELGVSAQNRGRNLCSRRNHAGHTLPS